MSKSPFTSQFMLYLWVEIPSDCKSERKPSEAPQKLGSHARFHTPISKCLSNSSILSKFSVMFAVHWPTFPFNHQPLLPVEHNGPGLEYKLSYRLLGVEDSWKNRWWRDTHLWCETPQHSSPMRSRSRPSTVTGGHQSPEWWLDILEKTVSQTAC